MTNKEVKILLASPRGFCAGVDRAIEIVEKTLKKFGPPVYVRHEIVHNKQVVKNLKELGAIFVEELKEIKDNSRPVIFSAHGVPKSVPEEAKNKKMFYIDATCPLVTKVHKESERHYKNGRQIILVGHKGHPEVVGTMGQLPKGSIKLIETEEDAQKLNVKQFDKPLAYVTQTTLSVDDTKNIVEILKKKFPDIKASNKEDICYATTNRQNAVKKIASMCEMFFVIGSENSSNSKRLVEVAKNSGCSKSQLISFDTELPIDEIISCNTIGLTSGASAPEKLVNDLEQNNLEMSILRNTDEPVLNLSDGDDIIKILLGELRRPVTIIVLSIISSLPVINRKMLELIPKLAGENGDMSLLGLIVKAILVGIVFYIIDKFV